MGFEPMNRGFADLSVRPLRQGAKFELLEYYNNVILQIHKKKAGSKLWKLVRL